MQIKDTFSCEVTHASMHRTLCGIGRAVVYYAQAVHAFSVVQEFNVGTEDPWDAASPYNTW